MCQKQPALSFGMIRVEPIEKIRRMERIGLSPTIQCFAYLK